MIPDTLTEEGSRPFSAQSLVAHTEQPIETSTGGAVDLAGRAHSLTGGGQAGDGDSVGVDLSRCLRPVTVRDGEGSSLVSRGR